MSIKTDELIDKVYLKLKNCKTQKLNLEKDEFKKFIYFLLNDN